MAEQAVQNAQSLHGFQLVPAFREIYERGRYDICQFARDFCDLELHDGQKQWVETNPWSPERVLGCANRWGKSVVSSVKHRHHALYQTRLGKYAPLTHDYKTCALSLTLDMARIVWDKAYYDGLAHPLYRQFIIPAGERDGSKLTPFPRMVVGDGGRGAGSFRSEIWARTTAREAQYLAGHSFDFLGWDEPARDPKGRHILDDILRMRMPDRDGRMDFTSTGNGKNWYFGYYMEASEDPALYAMSGTAYDNPYISHDALHRAEKRMSPELARQNIYGGFADTGNIFSLTAVEACYDQACYQEESFHFPELPKKNARYAMAIDFGRLHDKTVMLVARIDHTPASIVNASELGNECTWPEIFEAIAEMQRTYNMAPALGDATSLGGDVVLDTLINSYGVHIKGHQVGGSKERKQNLILKGQQAVHGQRIVWPFVPQLQPLVDQLLFYNEDDRNLDTDWVMAFCLLAFQIELATQVELIILSAPTLVAGLRQYFGEPLGVPLAW